ncbi:hypothetical protein N7520_009886 [Penicillium odoratum]|uniref:uncharacterized protein n=1 Tax=Penicillium odoratum TaxID=1167516 RepID=UPI0025472DF4|nr:uncharacterized protein N7520_009886 [Penicillium odoratum]KAJ5752969.1 hypothetical protein N7520_009886 [Penicillium odoratum]
MGSTNRQTSLPMRPSAPIPDNEDSDPTSSSGSSSSESDSEDSEDENDMHHEPRAAMDTSNTSSIPNVSGRPKPKIHKMQGNSELLARLSSFLPKMKSANEDLEKEIAAGRGKDIILDEVDDDKDYIEMNLGLGVLEEKRDGDSSGDEADDEDMGGMESGTKKSGVDDILEKLMGGKDLDADKPSIEELGQ